MSGILQQVRALRPYPKRVRCASPRRAPGWHHRVCRGTVGVMAALVLLLGLPAAPAAEQDRFTQEELAPLLARLELRGHDPQRMREIFFDDRLRKVDRVISFNTLNPDSAGHYAQYTQPYAISIARRFYRRQYALLKRNEERYGIPAEVLVAVLLVETQFGRARLPFRVLDVFTTLVVEDNDAAIDRHYRRLRNSNPELSRERVAERIQQKAQWASDQLSALLHSDEDIPKSLVELRGSYAGAFGMPQFIPSSYQRWALDGDGDGKKDLDHLPDALASMGNFLNAHGWLRGAPFSEQYRAVWEYNRSPHYVQAIFEIAFRLKSPPPKRPWRPRIKAPSPSPKEEVEENLQEPQEPAPDMSPEAPPEDPQNGLASLQRKVS